MAKFPTYEEIGKMVAEKALDEFLYNGKSIREWMQIITSEDAVSRQSVIDVLNKTSGIRGDALKALYELPPVTPQTKWIPVNERLPEESLNSVIGWDAHRERCVFVQYIDGYFQITGSDESFNIVAWMPLPEPYKAESESEE